MADQPETLDNRLEAIERRRMAERRIATSSARRRISTINRSRNESDDSDVYWNIMNPSNTVRIFDILNMQDPPANIIYWPDYKVFGTLDEIYNTFNLAGMGPIGVGALHTLSDGSFGNTPGVVPLTANTIYRNSIDPGNRQQRRILIDINSSPLPRFDRVVYLPQYRLRGTTREIYNTLRQSGLELLEIDGVRMDLNEENIYQNAVHQILSRDDINTYSIDARSESNVYWEITNPTNKIRLSDATNYVYSNHPNDRFVYWPDNRVAGSVSDIVNIFSGLGLRRFANDGILFRLSNGRFGRPPMTMDLTEENVYLNSFDPTIEEHRQLIETITGVSQISPETVQAENKFSLESYENLLRQLYNLPINIPEYLIINGLKVNFIPFSQLGSIQIERYLIDPLLQPWVSAPYGAETQNRIITIFGKNGITYLVKARYDPVGNQIFSPI